MVLAVCGGQLGRGAPPCLLVDAIGGEAQHGVDQDEQEPDGQCDGNARRGTDEHEQEERERQMHGEDLGTHGEEAGEDDGHAEGRP